MSASWYFTSIYSHFVHYIQHWTPGRPKWIKKNKGWQPEWKTAALEKVQHCWNESYKPTTQARACSPISACLSESQSTNVCAVWIHSDSFWWLVQPQPYLNSQASSFAGDNSDEEEEEDEYACFLHVQRPVPPEECPNPSGGLTIRLNIWISQGWLLNILSFQVHWSFHFLVNEWDTYCLWSFLGTSVNAEHAFLQCILVLGKHCTQLSDEIFHASLLLCSWDLAGILPELGQLTQCSQDSDEKKGKQIQPWRVMLQNEGGLTQMCLQVWATRESMPPSCQMMNPCSSYYLCYIQLDSWNSNNITFILKCHYSHSWARFTWTNWWARSAKVHSQS